MKYHVVRRVIEVREADKTDHAFNNRKQIYNLQLKISIICTVVSINEFDMSIGVPRFYHFHVRHCNWFMGLSELELGTLFLSAIIE